MTERNVELIFGGVSLVLIAQILLGGFSLETRTEIRERAKRRFGKLASEKSGRDDEPLECAHINHDPRLPSYDRPSNGRLLTLSEHLADHINREGRNGLSIEQNRWAIEEIRKRLAELVEEPQQA